MSIKIDFNKTKSLKPTNFANDELGFGVIQSKFEVNTAKDGGGGCCCCCCSGTGTADLETK